MNAVTEIAPLVGIVMACAMLAVARATYYRTLRPTSAAGAIDRRHRERSAPEERRAVLDVLHEPRFVDLAPAEVYATLLDERPLPLLGAHDVPHPRGQSGGARAARPAAPPELPAPRAARHPPNQLWSWDITKLLGPQKWTYFYLYVILDVFSRYVVGWMVAHEESARSGREAHRRDVPPSGHRARAAHPPRRPRPSMTCKAGGAACSPTSASPRPTRGRTSPTTTRSRSPLQDAQVPARLPRPLRHIEHARGHCGPFFPWYNDEHHHGSSACCTPHDVHYGLAARPSQRRAPSSTPPSSRTPSASLAAVRPRRRSPTRSGSTNRSSRLLRTSPSSRTRRACASPTRQSCRPKRPQCSTALASVASQRAEPPCPREIPIPGAFRTTTPSRQTLSKLTHPLSHAR